MMQLYQILSLLGVGTLCSLIVTYVFNSITNGAKARKKKNQELLEALEKRDETMRLGIQALLRDRLLEIYEKCCKQGYAPIPVRENFENIYSRYHDLGANGVMDSVRDKFLALPMNKPEAKRVKKSV